MITSKDFAIVGVKYCAMSGDDFTKSAGIFQGYSGSEVDRSYEKQVAALLSGR